MGEWIAQTPALIAALGVVFVPGLLIGLAARMRGLTLLATAPLISTAALGVGSVILGLCGIGWRPMGAGLVVIFIVVVVGVIVRAGGATATVGADTTVPRWLVPAGASVGIALTTTRLAMYMTAPDAISQTNDASFHLSALRFAVDTGWASPLQITTVIGAATPYPSGWHVLAALVPQLTGASVEVAANTVSLVIGGVVWPLGIALFVRAAAGHVAAAVAATAAGAVPAFPLLMIQWGVLYPQLLAVALLPAAVAAVLQFREMRGTTATWGGDARAALLAVCAAAALMLAQPSVLLAWAVSALLIVASGLIDQRGEGQATTRRAAAVAAIACGLAGTCAVWWWFGRSIEGVWPPTTGKVTAVAEVLVNGYLGYPWAIGVSILLVIGLLPAIKHPRSRWMVPAWLFFGALYVVGASVGAPFIRRVLTGPWYEDPYRLAAMMPMFVLALAGVGAATVTKWFARTVGARPRVAAIAAVGVVGAVGVASLVVAPQVQRRDVFAHRVDPNLYTATADSYLSADELTLLRRLDQLVPEDAVVIGNPSTGMAFGYALSGRNVLPRTWAPPDSSAYAVLWNSLRDVADDPEVCGALNAFGARYVLDFGAGEEYPGRWLMPGFDGLDTRPGFELVDREGDATLWRVTACD